MNKRLLLKKIVENPDFKKKYWPSFEVNESIDDYSTPIIRSGNPFLKTLYSLIIEVDTPNIKYKKLLKHFKL